MVSFFLALRPFPDYGLAVLAAVTSFGLYAIDVDPRELDSALGLLLFVQMFMVSTGFAVTAHRGHFDPMLGHGRSRTAALAAHWTASAAPGLLAWMLIVAAGCFFGSPGAWSAALGTRAAAIVIVSSLAWSAGFRLPRGAAGVIWMAVLMWLLLRHADLMALAGTEATPMGVVRTAGVIELCPFLLLGNRAQPGIAATVSAVSFALVVLLLTWRHGSRLDVHLVERV